MIRQVLRKICLRIASFLRPRAERVPVCIPILETQLLKGRRALITGGTSGIGYGIAKAFLRAGADVVITGRNAKRVAQARSELLTSCSVEERRVAAVEMDMTDVDSFEAIVGALGDFDILVNNAGVADCSRFGEVKTVDYDNVLDVNLRGPFLLAQVVAKSWISKKVHGNILNICSASSKRPGVSPYILSKWGLRALTKGLAKLLIRHDIVVNGLAPGLTDSPMFFKDKPTSLTNESNPSGRLVTVDELANLAVILTSSLCRMVVGDVLYATGGAAIFTFDD